MTLAPDNGLIHFKKEKRKKFVFVDDDTEVFFSLRRSSEVLSLRRSCRRRFVGPATATAI
jgi:hypothetical protein